MAQEQRLDFLIRWLLKERKASENTALSPDLAEKRRILRSLMNVRPPAAISEEFLKVQDAYLEERLAERGTVSLKELTPVRPGIYLWQGDITRLAVDAVVNAANSQMLGCFVPLPRLYRQCDPYLCGNTASAGLCPHHGGAKGGGTRRKSQNHKSL